MLMQKGIGGYILRLLSEDASNYDFSNGDNDSDINSPVNTVLQTACKLMKELCVHNDLRKDTSCAFDNGKYFLSTDCMRLLLFIAKRFRSEPALAAAALAAAKQLINTEEAVKVAGISISLSPHNLSFD